MPTRRISLLALALTASTALAVAPSAALAAPSTDPNLAQTVAADEANVHDRAELAKGHVDVGPRMTKDGFKLLARDDTKTPPVWRDPAEMLVRVHDAAQLEIPADKQYDFLGLKAGEKAFVIPQTQNQQVVWLGWNTQDPAVTKVLDRGAQLVFHRVQGPGSFHVFLQNGFDAPQPLWDGGKPAGQKIWVDVNTHTHANWVFSKPGTYLVDFSVEGKGLDGKPLADRATLRFAVGDQAGADEAFAATFPDSPASAGASGAPSAGVSASSGAGSSAGSDTSSQSGATGAQGSSPVSSSAGVVAGSVAAIALLGGVIALVVVRQRRAKVRAERELEGTDEI